MQGKIALEEHFAIPATLGDSKVFGAQVWDALGPRIRHVHVKDARAADADGMDLVMTGEGIFDIPALLGVLDAGGYDGYLSFEWERAWHPDLAPGEVEERLRRELAPLGERVIFAGQVPSLPALLAASRLVLFPVDDLYGKVDLPLSVLEAQALGVPVVALQQGPLVELEGAVPLPSVDRLAEVCLEVLGDERAWGQHQRLGRDAVARRHDPVAIAEAYEQVYDRL